MASLNQCSFSGTVGQDPEVKYLESGKVLAKLSLAIKDYRQETQWVNLVAWAKIAETIANYVKKGSKVIVTAEFQEETWEDKESGKKRSKPIFNVRQLYLLDKKDATAGGSSSGGSSSGRQAQRSTGKRQQEPPDEEEIPF